MKIDPTRWMEAEDATDRHRSQVQGFLYRDDDAVKNEKRAGLHALRDLTLPPGRQIVWQAYADHDSYEAARTELEQAARRYRLNLIIAEYGAPAPTLAGEG